MREPELSILIPVFNEQATVKSAVDRILGTAYPVEAVELVIVDDGSVDGTPAILAALAAGDPRIKVVTHERNGGKGEAVKTAIANAGGTYAAIMDADLEYEPSDIGRMLEPVLA